MKGECYLCRLERRGRVDADLAEGMSTRKVAAKYGASATTVHRHRSHGPKPEVLPAVLIDNLAGRIDDAIMGETQIDRSRWVMREVLAVLQVAKDTKNPGGSLEAIDRLIRMLIVEGQALDREGPPDRYMVMTWEDPEP